MNFVYRFVLFAVALSTPSICFLAGFANTFLLGADDVERRQHLNKYSHCAGAETRRLD